MTTRDMYVVETEREEGRSTLLDELLATARLEPEHQAYALTKKGVQTLVARLVEPKEPQPGSTIAPGVVDCMIAEIDRALSRQLDEILHHEAFQKLESAWR